MIKIRYADLPEGSHVEVRSDGVKTVIYLTNALSPEQRRAALGKARQAARVGRSAPLPLAQLALALFMDKIRTTFRAAIAAARVHPVGFAVPAAIIVTAVVLYTFVTSVTIHIGHPPQADGRGPGGGSGLRGSSPTSPASPSGSPQPGASASYAAGGQSGSRSGTSPGRSGHQVPPSRVAASAPGAPNPGPSSSPGPVSSESPSPNPSPSPTSTSGGGGSSGTCLQVGPLGVCLKLRAGL